VAGDLEKIEGMCLSIPDDLERAEVEHFRRIYRLQGSARSIKIPTPEQLASLKEARRCLPLQDIWVVDMLIHSDDGASVAASITDGTAYAVSDGSYKQNRGTSAFLLEGKGGETNRVVGVNGIPGAAEDQSAYSLELGGISGVIAAVHCIYHLHLVTKGTINCRLDGYQALIHGFGVDPLNPQKTSFNLLTDIRNNIKASLLT
jgi:hypothetical protein